MVELVTDNTNHLVYVGKDPVFYDTEKEYYFIKDGCIRKGCTKKLEELIGGN